MVLISYKLYAYITNLTGSDTTGIEISIDHNRNIYAIDFYAEN